MCGATAITGQRTCLCLSESGAMVQAVMSTCGDGIQTAQQDPSQSPFLDANDALVFILHDSPNDVAGTILDVSLSPSFAFNSATIALNVRMQGIYIKRQVRNCIIQSS